jgi:predicted ester cyclase
MRTYVAIIAAAGLLAGACGKKAPEPQKTDPTSVAKTDPPKTDPPKTDPPKTDPPKTDPPKTEPPKAADHATAIQDAFVAWVAGDYEKAFADFADDVTYTIVGMPGGESKGKAAVVEAHKKRQTGMTDTKLKASRIIDAGEFLVVEFVFGATNSGALADGTAATNKSVALQGALVFHYTAEGKIDQVADYGDHVSFMQQLGLMPGLPEGFLAPKLPETTEVVKADKNDANKDAYTNFYAKLTPETYAQLIKDSSTDDVAITDLMAGKTVTGKEAVTEWFKQFYGMFPDIKFEVKNVITAGDWLVGSYVATGTYKGGIPDVEAKDQKVTMTGLDVFKFEGGKLKVGTGYGNGLELLGALGVQLGGAAAKPPEGDAAADIGVASCDAYIKATTACIEKMPEAARAPAKDAMAQATKAWRDAITGAGAAGADAAKSALETGCKQALAATKQGMAQLCPDVKWE